MRHGHFWFKKTKNQTDNLLKQLPLGSLQKLEGIRHLMRRKGNVSAGPEDSEESGGSMSSAHSIKCPHCRPQISFISY